MRSSYLISSSLNASTTPYKTNFEPIHVNNTKFNNSTNNQQSNSATPSTTSNSTTPSTKSATQQLQQLHQQNQQHNNFNIQQNTTKKSKIQKWVGSIGCISGFNFQNKLQWFQNELNDDYEERNHLQLNGSSSTCHASDQCFSLSFALSRDVNLQ
jgi:transposase